MRRPLRALIVSLLLLPACGDDQASADGSDTDGGSGTDGTAGTDSTDSTTGGTGGSDSDATSGGTMGSTGSPDPEDCANTVDDDLDGEADCADPDCETAVAECWTCNPIYYDEDPLMMMPFCDCGCGIPDPDCEDVPAPPVFNCMPGQVCSDDSTCVAPDPEADCADMADDNGNGQIDCLDMTCFGEPGCPPTGWTCPGNFYDEDPTKVAPLCDCQCGIVDPDCTQDPNAPVFGCDPDQICTDQATCMDGTQEQCANTIDDDGDFMADCADTECFGQAGCPPVDWTCSGLAYDEAAPDEACDCECGVLDPDCSDPQNPLADCVTGETCNTTTLTCDLVTGEDCDNTQDDDADTLEDCDDQECFGVGTCSIPGWVCNPALWNEGMGAQGCDCNCGAYDPDCDDDQLPVYGCAGEATCSDTGTCMKVVPPEWACNPAFYGGGDGCDCGCGVVDPDCMAATVGDCDFCNLPGSCSATACPGDIDPVDNGTCP